MLAQPREWLYEVNEGYLVDHTTLMTSMLFEPSLLLDLMSCACSEQCNINLVYVELLVMCQMTSPRAYPSFC